MRSPGRRTSQSWPSTNVTGKPVELREHHGRQAFQRCLLLPSRLLLSPDGSPSSSLRRAEFRFMAFLPRRVAGFDFQRWLWRRKAVCYGQVTGSVALFYGCGKLNWEKLWRSPDQGRRCASFPGPTRRPCPPWRRLIPTLKLLGPKGPGYDKDQFRCGEGNQDSGKELHKRKGHAAEPVTAMERAVRGVKTRNKLAQGPRTKTLKLWDPPLTARCKKTGGPRGAVQGPRLGSKGLASGRRRPQGVGGIPRRASPQESKTAHRAGELLRAGKRRFKRC